MSSKSNNQGRALEFAYISNLKNEISQFGLVKIVENSSYYASAKAWSSLSKQEQNIYNISSLTGIKILFQAEPLILECQQDCVDIMIQKDSCGQDGDVRDILLTRDKIQWEIGLSIKHNHFSVKHSRISPNIDFGKKWYGIECSKKYYDEIFPIFEYLSNQKNIIQTWNNMQNKEEKVYKPLLSAFRDEISRQNNKFPNKIPRLLTQYLLGIFDFYKIISLDAKQITQFQSYNMNGTLNKNGKKEIRKIKIPLVVMPTRIINFDFKPNSSNTLELFLDAGWQFSFRIHNASTKIENSLKFDIKIIGMPTSILTINSSWV